MAGRKPKPTAMKKLEGNQGKRKDIDNILTQKPVAISRKIYRHHFFKNLDVTIDITTKRCYICIIR